jgi:hypothetical protein
MEQAIAEYRELLARLRRRDPTLTEVFPAVVLNNRGARRLGRDFLRGNPHVTSVTLALDGLTAEGNYDALLEFIENSPNLEFLALIAVLNDCFAVTARFLRAAARSAALRTLNLPAIGDEAARSLPHFLRETTSLETLCIMGIAAVPQAVASDIETALGQNRTVKTLMLHQADCAVFAAVMRAMQVNPIIEMFRGCSGVMDSRNCETLAKALPTLSLKKLDIGLNRTCGLFKDLLMQGFKQNGTLTNIKVQAPFLTSGDLSTLAHYGQRNEKLPPLLSLPHRVPVSLVPKVSAVALDSRTGPEWVFRLLSDKADIGQPIRRRGRKRPRRYEEEFG